MPRYLVTLRIDSSRTFPMEAENEIDAYQRAAAGEWTDAEWDHPEATADSGDCEVGFITREVDGEGGDRWYEEELAARVWAQIRADHT